MKKSKAKPKGPIVWANAKDKVGKVRVYKCPICEDGSKLLAAQADLTEAKKFVVDLCEFISERVVVEKTLITGGEK